jgi:hypothetical protein
LLKRRLMKLPKLMVASSVILFALCAPALAGTPPPQAAPPPATATPSPQVARSVALAIEVKDGASVLHYALPLETERCGSIDDTRSAGVRDLVDICLTEVANGIGIRVNWRSVRGAAVYEVKSSAVATSGKPFTIGRDDGPHLTVTWR